MIEAFNCMYTTKIESFIRKLRDCYHVICIVIQITIYMYSICRMYIYIYRVTLTSRHHCCTTEICKYETDRKR